MRIILILTSILFVCSCASPLNKQYQILESTLACCNEFKEIDYLKMHPSRKNKIKLTQDSPVFDFGNDKSYFVAYELPDLSDRYFYVKSYFNGMFIGQYFDPIFFALDYNYKPIEAFSLKLQFFDGNIFGDSNAHMAGVFTLASEAKYLVIMTAKDFGDKAPVARIPPSATVYMIGNTPMVMPVGGNSINLEKSPTGQLSIQLKKMENNS